MTPGCLVLAPPDSNALFTYRVSLADRKSSSLLLPNIRPTYRFLDPCYRFINFHRTHLQERHTLAFRPLASLTYYSPILVGLVARIIFLLHVLYTFFLDPTLPDTRSTMLPPLGLTIIFSFIIRRTSTHINVNATWGELNFYDLGTGRWDYLGKAENFLIQRHHRLCWELRVYGLEE